MAYFGQLTGNRTSRSQGNRYAIGFARSNKLDDSLILDAPIETPAFVYSIPALLERATRLKRLSNSSSILILYTTKACSLLDVVARLSVELDGLSVSSCFEAQWARESAGPDSLVQYVNPLLKYKEHERILELCDRVTVNSLSQLERFREVISTKSELGIRINPQLSWVDDPRYDPCRNQSKLGVPVKQLRDLTDRDPAALSHVAGLHFHSNCDSGVISEWVRTLHHVESTLGDTMRRFRWINIGGGYTLQDDQAMGSLMSECLRISKTYNLQVVIEPGADLVRPAGFLVATVNDLIECDNTSVAVLDTTVGHWPEVFEYQFEPNVIGERGGAPYTYILAGSSCLAGDVFGIYSFDQPLVVGSRIVFEDAGAYSIVKAHMFNGINLPSIYVLTELGEMVLRKEFTYEDFASRWGVDTHALI